MTAQPDDPDEDRPSLEGIPPRPGHGGAPDHGGTGQVESAAVRANRALELRMAGATYQQIATALGWSNKGTAYEAVQRALTRDIDSTKEVREEYREVQLARTERLLRGVWTAAIGGDLHAVDRAIKLLERQSRLLGLDAPVQVSVTDDTRLRITSMLDDLEARVVKGEVVDPDDAD